MLTPKQRNWLSHLSDTDKIIIKPFDPTTHEKFEKVKQKIQDFFGYKIKVEHHGATSMGISGQDEIDIYIPVVPSDFNNLIKPLTELFGSPKSLYTLERAKFVTTEDGKHIDVFLINKESAGWKDCVRFEKYLKTHPKMLSKYKKLKEQGNGVGVREYYTTKINFINEILTR